MFKTLGCAVVVLLAISSTAQSAEPDGTPVPAAVLALTGCWEGQGEVLRKPVAIAVSAHPIVQDAMLAVETTSSAIADPGDRYSAHLIFGGAGKQAGATAERVTGYWADSFGGGFAAPGSGESHADGFDIAYQYADNAFVNRWRVSGDRLTWRIVARNSAGVEKPFASYALRKTACSSSALAG